MKLNLLSCKTQRPDRKVISKCIFDISYNMNESLSNELTVILLEGDSIEIEIENKSYGSALRALRRLNIDYEVID